jgi:hypothetical protein
MRSKLTRLPAIPERYKRFNPAQWPGGAGEYISERESWAAAQPPIVIAGSDGSGRSWAYEAGPLGDACDLMKARREARILAYSGISTPAADSEIREPGARFREPINGDQHHAQP